MRADNQEGACIRCVRSFGCPAGPLQMPTCMADALGQPTTSGRPKSGAQLGKRRIAEEAHIVHIGVVSSARLCLKMPCVQ